MQFYNVDKLSFYAIFSQYLIIIIYFNCDFEFDK